VRGKLNNTQVKALRKPGRYTDGGGLMLYVKESGSKTWVLRLTINGKRRDIGLGSFDDVSLNDARDARDEMRKVARNGADPLQQKREAKRARIEGMTFRQAAEAAHKEQKAGWRNAKHRAQWLSSLEAYAYPLIGNLPVADIDGPRIRDLLVEIWLTKPETARRVRQRIGAVLDWAYAKGLRANEAPMRSIGKGLPRQPKKDNHFAALPYAETPELMRKLAMQSTVGRLALRFLILTAARSGEVRLSTWKEVDLDEGIWIIPADRMKAGKEHMVPLSAAAISVLEEVARTYGQLKETALFPGKGGKALSDMTLTKVLRTELPGAHTVHGFRSAFRDWAAEQTDFPGEVVEAALAHTIPNKVEAAYRRTKFLDKRRTLMTQWAQYLDNNSDSSRNPPKGGTDKTA
jgi:integrase